MALKRLAEEVASRFGLTLAPAPAEDGVPGYTLTGQGVTLTLAAYFGGWQGLLQRDGKKAHLFAEDGVGLMAQLRSYGLEVKQGSVPREVPPR